MPNATPPNDEGPYVIEHGEVWFVHNDPSTPGGKAMRLDRRHICGPSDELAIAFDEDDGTLHKHGTATSVRTWIDNYRAKTASFPPDMALPVPLMMTFAANADAVAELNRCIATTGRIKGLYEDLIASARPTLL